MENDDEERVKQEFGRRLREIRKSKKISQEALALSCGLDRTYIGGVERGERNISLVNIHRIARAIDMPVEQFFKVDRNV